jgi:hypothetical protein
MKALSSKIFGNSFSLSSTTGRLKCKTKKMGLKKKSTNKRDQNKIKNKN